MNKITPFLIAFFMLIVSNFMQSQVVINEILSSNTAINQDEDATYQDWIEFRNNGATTVNLSGYGLTDDALLPFKWTFPNVSIASGQYLLVWCSSKNKVIPGNPLHTNFKLSASGDVILFSSPAGAIINSIPATYLPENVSYGRLPNGTGSFVYFSAVTPSATNGGVGYNQVLPPPTFSKASGVLTAGFNLTISTIITGATILYTLDGSEPKATNLGGTTYMYKNKYSELVGQATGPLLSKSFTTLQYSTPLAIVDRSSLPNKISGISSTYSFDPTYIPTSPIFKGTVVKAKVIKAGALDSDVITKTYFISPLGTARYTLPIVSLSLDENQLFDYNNGIYVAGVDYDTWRASNPTLEAGFTENIGNYYRLDAASEKVANFSYFVNGLEVLNQDIGIKIHGGASRVHRSKSFSLAARSDVGPSSMGYKFFSDITDTSFKKLVLRNSGTDFPLSMFKDALNQELVKSLHVETEGYQPTETFINGEYWGILNIREKYDANYFSRVMNFGPTDLDYIENEDFAQVGDNTDYLQLVTYLQNNSLSGTTNYNYINTRLDTENFKDFFISNIFFQNADWPGNNVQCWRKRVPYTANTPYGNDGRWRWAIHDMDNTFSFGTDAGFDENSLAVATATNGPEYPNPPWSTLFLRKLLENNTFKNEFINRFADLLNTSFSSSRVIATMNSMKAVLAPEMAEHLARWKTLPFGVSDWNYLLGLQTDFANQRPALQRNHIRSKFGIASNINAILDVSNATYGYIVMNTIDIKVGTPGITANPYPWTGIYFSNIPVILKAIANPGYVFSHWTGASTSTNPIITITSATSFNVTAVFAPEAIPTSQTIYYWMMNSQIANNLPLQTLNSTYKTGSTDGVLQYQSCLVGYPFVSTDLVNWRKASMERRNSPTDINYIPLANNSLPFANSDMKGLQIKEPLQSGTLGNNLIFSFSTVGKKDIKFSFAAINELTNATAISIDYSVNSGTPVWITTGLASSSLSLTAAYQLMTVNFSSILTANNNTNFKVLLRFTGANMTVNTGARITFNNFEVKGTLIVPLAIVENESLKFSLFPNPFSDIVTVVGINETQLVSYKLFTIDGKQIKNGNVDNTQIYLNDLSKGIYLLQLSSDGKIETKKIIKQ